MFFTFLSITYNHKKFILQHLESIKYQIINYGTGHSFQLVISDDSSKDNTIELINKWLESNNYLFSSVKVLTSEENRGICKNYIRGIKNIDGEYYKTLAGDDLYAKDNIFEAVELLKEYDIVISPVVPFGDNKLFEDKKLYSRVYQMLNFVRKNYKVLRRNYTDVPNLPGIFLGKGIFTDEVINFISQYKMIEDRSQFIKIYEQNSNLSIGKYEKSLVLYRYHDNAVTKTSHVYIKTIFEEESTALQKYVYEHADNYLVKIREFYNVFILSKINNRKMKLLISPNFWLYRISFVFNYPRYRKEIKRIVNDCLTKNRDHLQYIIDEAKKYE